MQLAQKALGFAILAGLAASIAASLLAGHGWCALGLASLTLLVASVARWVGRLSEQEQTNIAFGTQSLRTHAAVLQLLRNSDASLSRIEDRVAALEAPTVPVQRRVVN